MANTEAEMKQVGITESDSRTDSIVSCAGAKLSTFWEKEVRISKKDSGEEQKHKYEKIVKETKK